MLGISIFSLQLTIGQIFSHSIIKQGLESVKKILVESDRKTKMVYWIGKIFLFIGKSSVSFSVPFSIYTIVVINKFFSEEIISEISNSATLLTMGIMLFYIYLFDNS